MSMDSSKENLDDVPGSHTSSKAVEVLLLEDSESSDSHSTKSSTNSQKDHGNSTSFSANGAPTETDTQQDVPTLGTSSTMTEESHTTELKKLSLDQFGTFMADFHPEKSKREMRKLNRKLSTKDRKTNQLYDGQGLYIQGSVDLCDCLDMECPGCHFPCLKCSSTKCGNDCRCNRKYTVDYIEIEGTDVIHSNPLTH